MAQLNTMLGCGDLQQWRNVHKHLYSLRAWLLRMHLRSDRNALRCSSLGVGASQDIQLHILENSGCEPQLCPRPVTALVSDSDCVRLCLCVRKFKEQLTQAAVSCMVATGGIQLDSRLDPRTAVKVAGQSRLPSVGTGGTSDVRDFRNVPSDATRTHLNSHLLSASDGCAAGLQPTTSSRYNDRFHLSSLARSCGDTLALYLPSWLRSHTSQGHIPVYM